MSEFKMGRVEPNELDRTLLADIESLAREAWTADLANYRTPEEVAFRFNATSDHIDEVAPIYHGFAKHGNLIVARRRNQLVGFAMARNDVSPNGQDMKSVALRSAKRLEAFARPRHSRVYAWLSHISVDPELWGENIGTQLVESVYGARFHHPQRASAYVFDEDERYLFDKKGNLIGLPGEPFSGSDKRAYDFITDAGFQVEPHNRQIRKDYFGPGSKPVVQYRFEGRVGRIHALAETRIRQSIE